MKYTVIIFLTLIVIFFLSQAFIPSGTRNIEMHEYKVIKKFEKFEIRIYQASNFTYTTMKSKSYDESSSKGFRTLAGYIFGGNEDGQEISMTSPVKMEMGDSIVMKFMIPSDYTLENMPKPNNADVRFVRENEKIVAAIQFSGWADDDKIEFYTNRLKAHLHEASIEHKGNFSFLGYNPPFEVFNRRNEIIVELESYNLKSSER